jgi:hypothetical protein
VPDLASDVETIAFNIDKLLLSPLLFVQLYGGERAMIFGCGGEWILLNRWGYGQ